MEPPHVILGSEEECHSNESGWTMYIGSPKDEDDYTQCDYDEGNGGDSFNYDYHEYAQVDPDVESDDSMASDASSGPSHHYEMIKQLGSSSGFHGFTHSQKKDQQVDCGKKKYCSDHKREASESKGKNRAVEKNGRAFINGKGKETVVQNDSKVKINNKSHKVGRSRN